MRLWHKDLISVLPRQQLLGQWRECCLIAKNIVNNGTPNHILVNKIMDYPLWHFYRYAWIVSDEMERRGYKCDFSNFSKYIFFDDFRGMEKANIFPEWHGDRYFKQCYYNLQEKYDCGAVTYDEWRKIHEQYMLIQEGLI